MESSCLLQSPTVCCVLPLHTTDALQIKWTPENDRKLLLIAFGREISNKEYKIIAEQVFWAGEYMSVC